MAKEKNGIVSQLTNVNHLEGAGIAIALDSGVQFLSRKISAKYGAIAGAVASYALTPMGANMFIKEKDLRASIIVGSKTLALKNILISVFQELYSATALSAVKETDATKQKASFEKVARYSKALELLGGTPPTLVVNNTSGQSSSAVPVSYNPTGSTGIEKGGEGSANDLKPETGVTRY